MIITPAHPISLFDEVKLQVQVLVPLLHAFRKEIGRSKADALVGQALRNHVRAVYHGIGERKPGGPREKWDGVWEEMDRGYTPDDGDVFSWYNKPKEG